MDPDPGPDPGPDPDLTIVVLGNTGVGKSASGNTILGREAFESRRAFRSVTTQISKITQTVLRKRISVVDTPGVLGSEREIQTCCQELLRSSRPCLFLVVVKIDRFTIEQEKAVDAAIRVIGDDGFSSSYLLFTSADVLNNMQLDDFINDDPDGPLKPVVERFEGRLHMFNNKDKDQGQVRELLEKSGHLSKDPPATKRRIVLLGLPGGGKSSSGNTILGSDLFESDCDFDAVSAEIKSKSAEAAGHWVTVVDTPGFTDGFQSQTQLYREIMTKADPGPHAFVIVVKLGRMSSGDSALLQHLAELLHRDAPNHTLVLFTHGDELGRQSIDQKIQSSPCVRELVSKCGDRYCVFDNRGRRSREQVEKFMEEIDAMVAANGGEQEHYMSDMFRSAGREAAQERGCWSSICCCCQRRNSTSGSDDDTQALLDGKRRPSYQTI